ncbi:MAG: hypothetical protein J5777_08280 [Clostridiales bacterium]|nr:hypothetical protein [Clostridiales bacterium]
MKTRKRAVLIITLTLLMAALTGCVGGIRDIDIPGIITRTDKYVNQSYAERHEDFSKKDLGGIRKDSRFIYCSPENLMRFRGYYRGLDFVTLVFEAASPVETEQLRREAEERYNIRLQGIIYSQDPDYKYVTYQYEPLIYNVHGEPTQESSVNDSYFTFKLNDKESETYYRINIKGLRGKYMNKDLEACEMVIYHRIQTEVIEESYWTDYRYNETRQFYHADTEKWNTSVIRNSKTNYMPLE